MALTGLGNLTVLYSPPSAANVNCENPRRKPVSHLPDPNWAYPSHFSGLTMRGFPTSSTGQARGSQDVHRQATFPACAKAGFGCKVEREEFQAKVEVSQVIKTQVIKAPAEVCPLCEGTGWKTVPASLNGRSAIISSSINDRRVTRCDCQLRARAQSLLTAARIPKRYEHCELSNYDTDFPGAHPSLAEAHFLASQFCEKCDPRGDKGPADHRQDWYGQDPPGRRDHRRN